MCRSRNVWRSKSCWTTKLRSWLRGWLSQLTPWSWCSTCQSSFAKSARAPHRRHRHREVSSGRILFYSLEWLWCDLAPPTDFQSCRPRRMWRHSLDPRCMSQRQSKKSEHDVDQQMWSDHFLHHVHQTTVLCQHRAPGRFFLKNFDGDLLHIPGTSHAHGPHTHSKQVART